MDFFFWITIEEIYKRVFTDDEKPKNVEDYVVLAANIPDNLITQKAMAAKNGDKFRKLMDGDWEGFEYPSASEADAALAAILAFYTQDPGQILRIIKQSGLWDEKWEREDYQKGTIEFALEHTDEHYDWRIGSADIQIIGQKFVADPRELLTPPIPEFSMNEHVPSSGLIRDYVGYMFPITEAPIQYHLFGGLILVAAILARSLYIIIADEWKYLNLWIVDVGPSGCKKTTSINKPMQILVNSGFEELVFPTQITTEKLIPMLSHQSSGVFFWPEWGATMDQWSKSYAQDAMSIFTSLYDNGYFSRWLKNEKYEIRGSSISLLCGYTLAWLKKIIKQSDVSMGFWPRFLLVPAHRRNRYIPNPPKGDPKLREHIEQELRNLQSQFSADAPREVDFSAVGDMYADWYEQANRAADRDSAHPYMAAFIVRLSDSIKKIAALVEISSSQSVNVTPETMEYTLRLADWLRDAFVYVMAETEMDEANEVEQRICDLISQYGRDGILHSTLRQKLPNYSRAKVEMAVRALEDEGRIEVVSVGKTGRGRPGKKYVAAGV